jgi:Tol biopolymer transport system component
VIRRLAGVLLVGCALFVLGAGAALAEVPAGPRLAVMHYTGNRAELLTLDPTGGQRQRIPGIQEIPSWTADGSKMAFVKLSGGKHDRRTDIYFANADGSDRRRIPGTRGGFDPVLSPDGHTLAFARIRPKRPGTAATCCGRAAVWLLDLETGSGRQTTPWRGEAFETPASFSPDGSTLAVEWEKEVGAEIRHAVLALPLAGGPPTVLAKDAIEPAYSPDGTRLALIVTGKEEEVGGLEVQPTRLAVANVDGSGLTKLTGTEAEEWSPAWDPSGQRLAYIQYAENGMRFFKGDWLMEINPDGTCRTKVLSYPKTVLLTPAWQPGPGREAGPISC